jgi:hypothetical protein
LDWRLKDVGLQAYTGNMSEDKLSVKMDLGNAEL